MKIETIYDTLITITQELFPNRIELVDTRDLSNNHDNLLQNGWGLSMEAMVPADFGLYEDCQGYNRSGIIYLTKKYFSKKMNTTNKQTAEKSLLVDAQSVIASLISDQRLKNITANLIIDGDTGIQNVYSEKDTFLSIGVNFNFNYVEES